MPDTIYQEVLQKGIWKKIFFDSEEITTYRLANDTEDPSLCLDFTFNKEGKLIQYVSKDYGFTEEMIKKEAAAGEGAYESVNAFANSIQKQKFNEKRKMEKVNSPARWDDKRYECYQDKNGLFYVWDREYRMVIFAEL